MDDRGFVKPDISDRVERALFAKTFPDDEFLDYVMGSRDISVRATINANNANRPKGVIEEGDKQWQIYANDQSLKAADYAPLIVAFRNGAPVRLSDIAEVVDGVQDLRNAGISNGKPAVIVLLYRQPGANIIDTVDRIQALSASRLYHPLAKRPHRPTPERCNF